MAWQHLKKCQHIGEEKASPYVATMKKRINEDFLSTYNYLPDNEAPIRVLSGRNVIGMQDINIR